MSIIRIAVYPGTFDPVTYGHLDIIRRSVRLFDKLIVGVAVNSGKGPLFSPEERKDLIQGAIREDNLNFLKKRENTASTLISKLEKKQPLSLQDWAYLPIEVKIFDNLLMDFVIEQGANAIVRGIRAVSDFEYEFQMAGMNSRLNPEVETLFLPASEKQHFIASRLVKEIACLGGDISSFVPAKVNTSLLKKYG